MGSIFVGAYFALGAILILSYHSFEQSLSEDLSDWMKDVAKSSEERQDLGLVTHETDSGQSRLDEMDESQLGAMQRLSTGNPTDSEDVADLAGIPLIDDSSTEQPPF